MALNNESIREHPSVIKTGATRKIGISGINDNELSVYKIPINLLSYNRNNGRIAVDILCKDRNLFNENEIQDMIILSNFHAFKKTKKNIEKVNQLVSGVVSYSGLVIDGNRRFSCLKKLNEEQPSNQNFKYFEAIILTKELSNNEVLIKSLELNIQLGNDKPLDYDPINKIRTAYEEITLKKNFTIKEYSSSINDKEKTVESWLNQANLINDFIDHIGWDKNLGWKKANDYKIQGGIDDISKSLSNINNEVKKDKLKLVLFDCLAVYREGDVTRRLRDINKAHLENEFFLETIHERIEPLSQFIFDTKKENENIVYEDCNYDNLAIIRNNNNCVKWIDEIESITKNYLEINSYKQKENLQINIFNDVIDKIKKTVKIELIKKLNISEREGIISSIDKLQKELEIIVNSIK